MKELIEQNISWDALGNHPKKDFRYEIEGAAIHKETGVFTVTLRLNFIMPALDMAKVRGILLHQFSDLSDVKFEYIYENVILSEEEIIGLFIPHMIEIINGRFAAITKTIEPKKYLIEDGKLIIFALGRLATEQLNDKVAYLFKGLLNRHFGIRKDVEFRNDEENYHKAAESWKSSEEADIRSSLEEEIGRAHV